VEESTGEGKKKVWTEGMMNREVRHAVGYLVAQIVYCIKDNKKLLT